MSVLRNIILLPVLFITVLCSTQTKKSIIEPGAVVEKLSGEFSFTEGPTTDSRGNVYFTDQPNDRIMVWTTGEQLETFMQPSGRSNGMYFDKDDHLWSCADEKNELWRIAPDKTVEVVLGQYRGASLNGPNDLWIAPDGAIWFTDPYYQRSWWEHKEPPQDGQCVYYLSSDRQTLLRVIDDMVQPNGITGTPDGKTLYVADIGDKKTWAYDIGKNGALSGKRLFCELGSDGMTIDERGNLYLTGKGVTVFDKNGQQIEWIEIPEGWTANVAFGGANRKSLFITSSKGLYRLRMQVKGVGSK
jgi:gluconolactonase